MDRNHLISAQAALNDQRGTLGGYGTSAMMQDTTIP